MEHQDLAEFALRMGEMAVAFKTDIDEPTLNVYFGRLSYLTMYQVTKAIDHIIDYDDRFPVVSRVKALAETNKKYKPVPIAEEYQIEEESTFPTMTPEEEEIAFAKFMEGIDKLLNEMGN